MPSAGYAILAAGALPKWTGGWPAAARFSIRCSKRGQAARYWYYIPAPSGKYIKEEIKSMPRPSFFPLAPMPTGAGAVFTCNAKPHRDGALRSLGGLCNPDHRSAAQMDGVDNKPAADYTKFIDILYRDVQYPKKVPVFLLQISCMSEQTNHQHAP